MPDSDSYPLCRSIAVQFFFFLRKAGRRSPPRA